MELFPETNDQGKKYCEVLHNGKKLDLIRLDLIDQFIEVSRCTMNGTEVEFSHENGSPGYSSY